MLSGCHQILHTVHNMQKADHQKDKSNAIEEQHFLIQIKVLHLDLFRIIPAVNQNTIFCLADLIADKSFLGIIKNH